MISTEDCSTSNLTDRIRSSVVKSEQHNHESGMLIQSGEHATPPVSEAVKKGRAIRPPGRDGAEGARRIPSGAGIGTRKAAQIRQALLGRAELLISCCRRLNGYCRQGGQNTPGGVL